MQEMGSVGVGGGGKRPEAKEEWRDDPAIGHSEKPRFLDLDRQREDGELPEPRGRRHKARAGTGEEMQLFQEKPLRQREVGSSTPGSSFLLPPSIPPRSPTGCPQKLGSPRNAA